MGTHWTDRRASKATIAHALRDRGWKLFGYTADASDSMTDYYAPAHWDGVATKSGEVVVLDIEARYANGGIERSGKVEMASVRVVDGSCDVCRGTGADPAMAAWPLDRARADARGFHDAEEVARRARGDRAVALMRDVVSPLGFLDDGRCRCWKCSGSGETRRYEQKPNGVVWPTFQGNPKGRNWHVEREGRILESGVGALGFGSADSSDSGPRAEKLKAFVDRIEAAARAFTAASTSEPLKAGEVQTRPSAKREGYLEIVFSAKPGAEVRNELKRRGFRWAPSSSCWYGPEAALHGLVLG